MGALIAPNVDPFSGQPEFKQTLVDIRRYDARCHGYFISAKPIDSDDFEYWTKIPVESGELRYVASQQEFAQLKNWCADKCPQVDSWLTLSEGDGGISRIVGFVNDKVELIFITAPGTHVLPDPSYLSTELGVAKKGVDRYSMLSGLPGDKSRLPGKMICSCYQVGEKQIQSAIEGGARTPEALGKLLQCGTNCGSCIPELSMLIEVSAETFVEAT